MSGKRKRVSNLKDTQAKKLREKEPPSTEDFELPSTSGGYKDVTPSITPDPEQISSPKTRHNRYDEYFEFRMINCIKVGVCKICTEKKICTEIKMQQSNTSGLKWHLQKNHIDVHDQLFPQKKLADNSQKNLYECFLQPKSMKNWCQVELEIRLVEFIAVKNLPQDFFSDECSQDYFSFINPALEMPKRSSITTKVARVFSGSLEIVKDVLQVNQSRISFTVDGWTSITGKCYYGITAHFIDENWKLQSLSLDLIPAKSEHKGVDIARLIHQSLKELGIIDKIQGITVDNANVNDTFLYELENILFENGISFSAEDQHFRCFAHVINLAVQDFLIRLELEHSTENDHVSDEICDEDDEDDEDDSGNELEEDNEVTKGDTNSEEIPDEPPVVKLRNLCKALKYSEQLKLDLEKFCSIFDEACTTLPLDVKTRWNSTYNMVSVGLKMKKGLSALSVKHPKLRRFHITDEEWDLLQMLEKYLLMFKQLSTSLCGDQYATLPSVVTGINILIDSIEGICSNLDNKADRTKADEAIILALQDGRNKLIKHYQKTNWLYCAVLIIDPRHKLETFDKSEWGRKLKEESYDKFEEIFRTQYADSNDPSSTDQEESVETLDDEYTRRMKALYGSKNSRKPAWKIELDNYLHLDRADIKTDILMWWKQHETCYPRLADMARDLLSITASSAPVERLFSKAGLVLRKLRNRLSNNNIRMLVCLSSWFQSALSSTIKKN